MKPGNSQGVETSMDIAQDSCTPPDWTGISDEILCPLCDYNLRGLAQPCCPECGYRFAWNDVLDPTLRRHAYLFEHHPLRNGWSFAQTIVGTLRPRRFWRSLHPMQPSHPGRLLLYWILTAGVSSLPLVLLAIPDVYRRCSLQYWQFPLAGGPISLREQIVQWIGPLTWYAEWYWVAIWNVFVKPVLRAPASSMLIAGSVAYLLWPFATFAILMIFQSTMRKGRIKPSHVLRCVLYSADAGAWLAPLLAMGIIGIWLSGGRAVVLTEMVCWGCLILGAILWLMMVDRLATAYRLYLRFQHPVATVLAAQLIVVLIALVLLASSSAGWF